MTNCPSWPRQTSIARPADSLRLRLGHLTVIDGNNKTRLRDLTKSLVAGFFEATFSRASITFGDSRGGTATRVSLCTRLAGPRAAPPLD